jgi:glucose-6-phosphate-specific signal transduction histidine kinase
MVLAAEPMASMHCQNNTVTQHSAHGCTVVLVKLETRFSHVCLYLWSFGQYLCSQNMLEALKSPYHISLGTVMVMTFETHWQLLAVTDSALMILLPKSCFLYTGFCYCAYYALDSAILTARSIAVLIWAGSQCGRRFEISMSMQLLPYVCLDKSITDHLCSYICINVINFI